MQLLIEFYSVVLLNRFLKLRSDVLLNLSSSLRSGDKYLGKLIVSAI